MFNIEFDNSELPWPETQVPTWQTGRYGKWELMEQSIPLLRGYFRGLQPMTRKNVALLDAEQDELWMSVTPMELESQAPAIAAAHGNVLVGGLGMGVYLYNVMQKSNVKRILVIERDESIIDMLFQNGMKHWGGVYWTIVVGDILDTKIESEVSKHGPFDFGYFDIWPNLGDARAWNDIRFMAELYKPTSFMWWGMELDFIAWASKSGLKPPPTQAQWEQWIEESELPIQSYDDAHLWSYTAAENVVQY